MRPNISWDKLTVPQPPGQGHRNNWGWSQNWARWYATTFAVGTPVKYEPEGGPGDLGLPRGSRGEVVAAPTWSRSHVAETFKVRISDARDSSGLSTYHVGRVVEDVVSDWEPMVDNWVSTPYTGRRFKGVVPNPIPAPPEDHEAIKRWMEKTFPVGTPVVFKGGGYQKGGWVIPDGVRGIVISHGGAHAATFKPPHEIEVRIYPPLPGDPRFAEPERLGWDWNDPRISDVWVSWYGAAAGNVWPLVDTWATPPYTGRKMKGTVPNRRTSRRVRRNVSEAAQRRAYAIAMGGFVKGEAKKRLRAEIRDAYPAPNAAEIKLWNKANASGGSGAMAAMDAYAKRTGIRRAPVSALLQYGWQNSRGELKANGRRRTTKWKELDTLVALAQRQGWKIEHTANGHLRWYPPDPTQGFVVTGSSRSDPRALKNIRALLTRAGLKANTATRWQPADGWHEAEHDVWDLHVADGVLSVVPYGRKGWGIVLFGPDRRKTEFGLVTGPRDEAQRAAEYWAAAGYPPTPKHWGQLHQNRRTSRRAPRRSSRRRTSRSR